jgi:hypothetical protein
MSFSKYILGLVLIFCLSSCGEEGAFDIGGLVKRQPVFGFSKPIVGKEVRMVDVIDEQLSLIVSDTSRLSVQFTSTPTGERLKVNDWTFDYEKAIKYKKYYFLHQLIDSSFYKVVVVGRYFTKYYGFEEPWNQNQDIYKSLTDTLSASILKSFKVDSLSSRDFVIDPSSKKNVKEFFKNLLKNSYLRSDGLINAVKEITDNVLEQFDIDNIDANEDIIIYPNPAGGENVIVTSDLLKFENVQLSIVSLSGQEIKCPQDSNSGSTKVNIEGLKSGSYFVVITNGGRSSSGKFVVVK